MKIKVSDIPTSAGIYEFINITNNKRYIGSSVNLRKRFIKHLSMLNSKNHSSIHFQRAWDKNGIENFEYVILEKVEDVTLLLQREQYYLDTLLFAQDFILNKNKKFLELGYNINPTSSNRFGTKQSQESINKSRLNNPNRKDILQYDFNGNLIKEWISAGEIESKLNFSYTSILQCCKHKSEYSHNYIWIYKEEYDDYKDYLESLKITPFTPVIWNKNLSYKLNKDKYDYVLFDRYGRFISKFKYQIDVANYLNASTSNLSAAKNKKIIKNHLLFDIDYDYSEVISNLRNQYSFFSNMNLDLDYILVYDVFNNFIGSFESVEDCAKIMNLSSNGIYNVLCGRRKQLRGFIFKYNNDIV